MAGSIRRQGKDTWELNVNLGRDPVTRRRHRRFLTVRGKKSDAERALTAALAERDNGIDVSPGKITVGEYLKRWLRDYATHNVALTTMARYSGIVENHLIPALGGMRLRELRPAHIQAAYGRWLEKGLSARSVVQHHRILKEALSHAVKWQFLAHNPCNAVEPPRARRLEMRVLSPEELKRALAAADGSSYGALIHLAAMTGMRQGELLGLRWRDVDLESRVIHVQQTVQWLPGRGFVFGQPKTPRSRRAIALSVESVQRLRVHRQRCLEQRVLVGPGYKDSGLVFTTCVGTPISPTNLRRGWRGILDAAALDHVRFHDLRHTAATLMLMAGVHPKVVSERLGHATISITLDTYSHVLPDMQRDATEAVERLLAERS